MVLILRAPNQPFHHAGDEFQCTVLTTDNQMALVSCSEEHVSICKRPVEITSIPPDSYGCAEGQYEYQVNFITRHFSTPIIVEFFRDHATCLFTNTELLPPLKALVKT